MDSRFEFGQQDAKEFVELLVKRLQLEGMFMMNVLNRCNAGCDYSWSGQINGLTSSVVVDPRCGTTLERSLADCIIEGACVCPACGSGQVSTRLNLAALPDQMVVQVLRKNGVDFDERPIAGCNPDAVKIGSIEYKVVAVVQHIGASMNSGHYVAVLRSGNEGGWVCLNDLDARHPFTEVQFPVGLKDVYLLVLERLGASVENENAPTVHNVIID